MIHQLGRLLSLARKTTPPCFLLFLVLPLFQFYLFTFFLAFLFLSFSPFLHLIHSPSTRWITNRVSSSTLQSKSSSSLPDARPSKLMISQPAGNQPTVYEQQSETTTTEGAPVAEDLPQEASDIGDSRKSTETETRSWLARAYACGVPGGRFPAKFGYQPIKSKLRPLVRSCTRIPRITCACTSTTSGYIKGVEWLTEPFGLGLAKV